MELIIDNEFRELLPPLPEEKRRQLEENVLRDGIREPLTVWQGIIIDGHNRYEIAQAHGLEFKTVEMQFATRDDVKYWMIMNQFGRRDLTTYERSVLALKLKPVIAAQAKERQGERTDIPKISRESRAERITAEIKAKKYPSPVEALLLDTVPRQVSSEIKNELRNAHTHVYFARIDDKMRVGVSATVETRIKQLKVSAPTIELVGDVLFGEGAHAHENKLKKKFASALISGEVYQYSDELLTEMLAFTRREAERKNETTAQVAKAAGVSENTIRKVEKIEAQATPEIKAALRTGDMSINQAFKEIKRSEKAQVQEERRAENIAKVEALETPLDAKGLFQTIVIDPPWDWGDEGDVNQFGRAKPEYSTMPFAEIKNLPVAKIADENCHLYLWVTNRSLPKAFELIEAWGFRYITCLTWVKPSIGMGNYFRGSTEQVLFAVKGSQPLKRHDVGTAFTAPRGDGHSSKPDEFYSLVETCSYAPFIDIFGRKERNGWAVWGENG